MASSSAVSQDDLVDNDFEKSNRRSRIRTARARQINTAAAVAAANSRLESVHDLDREADHQAGVGAASGGAGGGGEEQGAAGPSGAAARDASGPHLQAGCEQTGSAAAAAGEFAEGNAEKGNPGGAAAAEVGAGEVSPKSRVVKLEAGSSSVSKNRSMMSKAHGHHHGGGKGKGPTRDRRKLREKRRSTGVVHLASTESTGGSTTGDDEESSDAVQGVCAETKRNTQHNESLISNSYKRARDKLNLSDEDSAKEVSAGSPAASLLPPTSSSIHLRGSGSGGRVAQSRAKSPSDLEADDENDHDSLNQSGAEGAEGQGSSSHIPGLMSGNGTDGIGSSGVGGTAEPAAGFGVAGSAVEQQLLLQQQSTNSSTPVVRPTTPIGNVDGSHVSPTRVERVLEENKRLLSLMEEKDRKIHLLEFKIEQLMKDTKTIVEDQSRLQVENTTLLKALSTLDKKQQVTKGGEK